MRFLAKHAWHKMLQRNEEVISPAGETNRGKSPFEGTSVRILTVNPIALEESFFKLSLFSDDFFHQCICWETSACLLENPYKGCGWIWANVRGEHACSFHLGHLPDLARLVTINDPIAEPQWNTVWASVCQYNQSSCPSIADASRIGEFGKGWGGGVYASQLSLNSI